MEGDRRRVGAESGRKARTLREEGDGPIERLLLGRFEEPLHLSEAAGIVVVSGKKHREPGEHIGREGGPMMDANSAAALQNDVGSGQQKRCKATGDCRNFCSDFILLGAHSRRVGVGGREEHRPRHPGKVGGDAHGIGCILHVNGNDPIAVPIATEKAAHVARGRRLTTGP